jgi:hypothetical protein
VSNEHVQKVVSEMMKQDTGKHYLDSGGYGGRRWQILANVDLTQLPRAWVDEDGYNKSMFWHLVDNIDSVADIDADYLKYDAEHTDVSWMETFEEWCKEKNIEVLDSMLSIDHETVLDGIFQAWNIEDSEGWSYTVISTHNGADYRGGYSQPRIFNAVWDDIIGGINDGALYCSNKECDERWFTHDAYHWYYDGNGNLMQSKKFGELKKCFTCGSELVA